MAVDLVEHVRRKAKSAAKKSGLRVTARAADIDPSQLRRFLLGARGLMDEAFCRLAESLGVRWQPTKPPAAASTPATEDEAARPHRQPPAAQ